MSKEKLQAFALRVAASSGQLPVWGTTTNSGRWNLGFGLAKHLCVGGLFRSSLRGSSGELGHTRERRSMSTVEAMNSVADRSKKTTTNKTKTIL